MKKRVTFLAALLVAACFGATVAMAEGSAKVTAQSGLNMRQGPGINYNVVTVLNNGATVNVVTPDDGNGWTYVTSGKNAGWVATKYLSGSAAIISSRTLPPSPETRASLTTARLLARMVRARQQA